MLTFPKFGVSLGGIDIGNLFAALFNILVEKKVLTENELVGFLTKAGFTFTRSIPEPASNPEVDLTKHMKDCLCEGCSRQRGLQ